jgi:hypothetical protein
MFPDNQLEDARQGVFETLQKLNERGFIPGTSETLEAYTQRLQKLSELYIQYEKDLDTEAGFTIEGTTFKKDQLIPQELFTAAEKQNLELYGFKIDWVPGFFYSPGALFGGCAFALPPEFFTLFVLRPTFKTKEKWYIYGRDELMAHELCHTARFALGSDKFEEMFAYQTATSKFRKSFGAMVRSPMESYIFMGLIFILMASQVYIYNQEFIDRRYFLPLPVIILMSLMLLYGFGLAFRQSLQNSSYKKLLIKLNVISSKPAHLAFRLDDQEMDSLIKSDSISREALITVLKESSADQFRIDLILAYCDL